MNLSIYHRRESQNTHTHTQTHTHTHTQNDQILSMHKFLASFFTKGPI